jgi:hypothetical protein
MAEVIEEHPDEVNEEPAWPVGALAGKLPLIEIADIKAARREALLSEANIVELYPTAGAPRGRDRGVGVRDQLDEDLREIGSSWRSRGSKSA